MNQIRIFADQYQPMLDHDFGENTFTVMSTMETYVFKKISPRMCKITVKAAPKDHLVLFEMKGTMTKTPVNAGVAHTFGNHLIIALKVDIGNYHPMDKEKILDAGHTTWHSPSSDIKHISPATFYKMARAVIEEYEELTKEEETI